jgi:ferredoxin-type protein NapG
MPLVRRSILDKSEGTLLPVKDSVVRRLSLTRRDFLALAGGASAMIGLGSLLSLTGRAEAILLPPGTPSHEVLLARCNRCHKCAQVCPTGVITPVLLRESPVYAGTPKLNFREGYCNLCMKCMEVCPSGALLPIEKGQIRLGMARIDEERCIAFKRSGCTICVDKCPEEAIELVGTDRLKIVEDRCNGCGLCENICPVGLPRLLNYIEPRAIIIVSLESYRRGHG